jgi:predicted MFS family arabinose efflux permease
MNDTRDMKGGTEAIPKRTTPDYGKLVLTLGLAGFVSAADNWFVSPSLAAIAADFGVTVPVAGIILTAYMIPYGFMQPVYGFFGDRGDKIRLLFAIVVGLALGTAGSALSGSLVVLSALRAITGLFAAGIIAVSLSVIGDVVPPDRRQGYVGAFMGIVFAGQGLSCGMGGFLAKFVSWRTAFLVFALLALVSALLLRTLSARPAANSSERRGGFLRQSWAALASRKGRVIFPLAFSTGFLLLGIYGYLGAYLNQRLRLDYLQSGLIVMFYGFACLVGGLFVGRLARRFGRKPVVLAGGVAALLAASLLILSDALQSWPTAFAATVALGAGYIAIQSTLATIAFDVIGDCRGLPSGIIGFCLFCGGGLGSFVAGRILECGGYRAVWIVFGACILAQTLTTAAISFDKEESAE